MYLIRLINIFTKTKKINYYNQKSIIDSFPEPKNDFERTDYNLECQKSISTNYADICCDFVAIVIIPILLLLYLFNSIRIKERNHKDTIIIVAGNRAGGKYNFDGRIPNLNKSYGDILQYKVDAFPVIMNGIADKITLEIYWKFVKRHPFSFFRNLRALINIMGYNYLLTVYTPSAILCSRMELNPFSSLVTYTCETKNCEFAGFMHGETFLNIRYSFARFSKFYIWDEYYQKIFEWARCSIKEYIVYKPGIHNVIITSDNIPEYFITYYLNGDEKSKKEKDIDQLREILRLFVSKGKRCKVRPHPRWSNIPQIKSALVDDKIDVESPYEVSIKKSILTSEYVMGTSSSVLVEAYYMGKKVIIDDISSPELIEELNERMYFLFSKEIIFLSDFIRNESIVDHNS